MKYLGESKALENFILMMIILSGLSLALENPLQDPNGFLRIAVNKFDLFTTAVFLIEVLIKVLANGLLLNGKDSYLRNSFQILDFFIVIASIISSLDVSQTFRMAKIMRSIRLLRPIRIISRNENLKFSIQALIVAIPSISSLMVITLMIMFVFGIIGMNLLKGRSFYCNVS